MAGPEDATLTDFADRFFKDIQSRDRKNLTMPRRYLEKDILPHIGSKPVRDITAEDVRSVIWRKKEQGFDAAAGQVRGLLKRMLDYALTCGLIQANPVMALPMRHVYRAVARERAQTLFKELKPLARPPSATETFLSTMIITKSLTALATEFLVGLD